MKLYWVTLIIGGEKPCLLPHTNPYLTLEKANESIKKSLESFDVILSYIQEQDTETDKTVFVEVTPYINSIGIQKEMGRMGK